MTLDDGSDPTRESPGTLGRVLQVVLGIYLLPIVLIVLVVGGLGMLGLAAGRLTIRVSRSMIPAPHLRLVRRPARLTH